MDVTPVIPPERQLIKAYGGGGFRIADDSYTGSVLVFPERTQGWPVASFDRLTRDDFAPVLAAEPAIEILILGSGPTFAMLPGPLRRELRAAGLGVEVMDTSAACRTYNVLLAEERRVAAALIAV